MAITEIKVPLIVQVEGANLDGWTEVTTLADISQGRRVFTRNAEPTPQEKMLQLQERVQELEAQLASEVDHVAKEFRLLQRAQAAERELTRVRAGLEQALKARGDGVFSASYYYLAQDVKGIIDGIAG